MLTVYYMPDIVSETRVMQQIKQKNPVFYGANRVRRNRNTQKSISKIMVLVIVYEMKKHEAKK